MSCTRLLALVMALAVASLNCSATTAYKLPLQYNQEPKKAEECMLSCKQQGGGDSTEYRSCLSGCPGFQKLKDEECGPDDRPPVATCVNYSETDATKSFALVGAIFVGLVLLAAIGGSDNKDPK